MKKLLILGAGGYGRTIADLAAQLNCYEKIAFLDDGRTGENILGKCGEFMTFADGCTEMGNKSFCVCLFLCLLRQDNYNILLF